MNSNVIYLSNGWIVPQAMRTNTKYTTRDGKISYKNNSGEIIVEEKPNN